MRASAPLALWRGETKKTVGQSGLVARVSNFKALVRLAGREKFIIDNLIDPSYSRGCFNGAAAVGRQVSYR
jgi:hypothetical protein